MITDTPRTDDVTTRHATGAESCPAAFARDLERQLDAEASLHRLTRRNADNYAMLANASVEQLQIFARKYRRLSTAWAVLAVLWVALVVWNIWR